MGLMATYRLKLPLGEVWDRALKLRGAKPLEGKRGSLIQIDSIPDVPEAKVQIFRRSVNVFCANLGDLNIIEHWLSKQLETPLGNPVHIKTLGARSAYYTSLEEIEGMLEKVRYPPDIEPDEFKDFVNLVFGICCEGEDITIPTAVQVAGLDAEKAERLLDFMTELGFTHIKPGRELRKIYRIGCPPEDDQRMRCESFESTGGAILFELGRGGLRLLRGPLPEIRGFCEKIGPFATCPKCNLLIPLRHGTRGRCLTCGTPYFRDSSGELVEDKELLKAENDLIKAYRR